MGYTNARWIEIKVLLKLFYFRLIEFLFLFPPQEPQSIVSPSWPSRSWICTCCTSWWPRREALWRLSIRRSGEKSQRDSTCLLLSPVQLLPCAHSKSLYHKKSSKFHFTGCSSWKLTIYTQDVQQTSILTGACVFIYTLVCFLYHAALFLHIQSFRPLHHTEPIDSRRFIDVIWVRVHSD